MHLSVCFLIDRLIDRLEKDLFLSPLGPNKRHGSGKRRKLQVRRWRMKILPVLHVLLVLHVFACFACFCMFCLFCMFLHVFACFGCFACFACFCLFCMFLLVVACFACFCLFWQTAIRTKTQTEGGRPAKHRPYLR